MAEYLHITSDTVDTYVPTKATFETINSASPIQMNAYNDTTVLSKGQLGYWTGSSQSELFPDRTWLKMGDGIKTFVELPLIGADPFIFNNNGSIIIDQAPFDGNSTDKNKDFSFVYNNNNMLDISIYSDSNPRSDVVKLVPHAYPEYTYRGTGAGYLGASDNMWRETYTQSLYTSEICTTPFNKSSIQIGGISIQSSDNLTAQNKNSNLVYVKNVYSLDVDSIIKSKSKQGENNHNFIIDVQKSGRFPNNAYFTVKVESESGLVNSHKTSNLIFGSETISGNLTIPTFALYATTTSKVTLGNNEHPWTDAYIETLHTTNIFQLVDL